MLCHRAFSLTAARQLENPRRPALTRAILAWLSLHMVACQPGAAGPMPEPEQKPRTAEGPQEGRLLSLAPTLTETLFAIGAGPRLVGRSDYCRQPASAEALPSFGTALTPQLESIARLQPSRVLVQQTSQPVSDLTALAPVSQLPWSSVDEVVASIRRLGMSLACLFRASTDQALLEMLQSGRFKCTE